MPDFSTLYSPEQSNTIISPDRQLVPLESPSFGIPGGDNTSFINNQFDKLQQQFMKPSVQSMLEPVSYDPETANRDRYTNSDYFAELGFNPFSNNEEIYGNRQGRMNKLKNAFAGMGSLAAHQFAEQFTSWGDTFSIFRDPTMKSAFEQMEMERIYREQKDFTNKYPVFETQADREGIFNFNTIANTIQQSGYAIGAIAEIAAEEAALTALTAATFGLASETQGARTAFLGMKLGSVIRKTEQLSNAVSDAGTMRKIFSGMSKALPLGNLVEFGLNAGKIARADKVAMGTGMAGFRTVSRGFGAFYRDVRELNAAISEAKAEAAGTYGELYERLISEYKDNHNGKEPSGFEQEDMKNTAMEAAHINGAVNTAALLLTNKLAFGNIFKGFKPTTALAKDELLDGLYLLSEKQAAKRGGDRLVDAAGMNIWQRFRQKMLASPWAALKYTEHNLGEAIQENIQDISNDAVTQYYQAKYDGKNLQWADAIQQAAGNEWSTQGAKTFISSFFTGAILGAGAKAFGNAGNLKNFVTDRPQYAKDKLERQAERKKVADNINGILKDPLNFTLKRLNNAPLQANFTALLKEAAIAGDRKAFNDIRDDAAREYILSGMRSGTLELVNSRMEDYVKNLKPEEFTKAFGLEYSKELHDNIIKQVQLFKERTAEVKRTYESITDTFPNPFNPFIHKKGSVAYNEQAIGYLAYQNAIDNVVFMKDTYRRGITRQNDILSAIRQLNGIKDLGYSQVYSLTSIPEIEKEINVLNLEAQADDDVRAKGHKQEKVSVLQAYLKDVRDFLSSYHKTVTTTSGTEQTEGINDLDAEISAKLSKHYEHLFNGDLLAAGKSKMLADDLGHATKQMVDYLKLQHEGGIMLEHINLIAAPGAFQDYLNRHINAAERAISNIRTTADMPENIEGKVFEVDGERYHITKMHEDGSVSFQKEIPGSKFTSGKWSKEFFEQLRIDGKLVERTAAAPKSITVKVDDKEITIKKGDVFVGKLTEEPGIYKEQTVTRYNNDKIRIHAIAPDEQTVLVTVNNDEGRSVPAAYLAKLINSEKWVSYDKLTPVQKTYLDLRNQAIQYRVIKKDAAGHTLYTPGTGKAQSQVVTGRIKMNKEKNGLRFIYTDPSSQKQREIDFNPKWMLDRKRILSLSEHIREGMEAETRRHENNYNTQKRYLSDLIRETESDLDKTQQLREANLRNAGMLQKDIEEAREELKQASEELERLGRKGGHAYKGQLKKIREEMPGRIAAMEQVLAGLQEERDRLHRQLDALNKTRDILYQGLDEIEKRERPFDKGDNQNIYDDAQVQLDELEVQRITGRLTPSQLDKLIQDTKAEVDHLDERIARLITVIDAAKKFLAEISVTDDVLSKATELAGSSHAYNKLRQDIISLKNNTHSDPNLTGFYNDILGLLNSSPDNISSKLIGKAQRSVDNLAKRLEEYTAHRDELAAKEFRLVQAREQEQNISSLKERIAFLKQIQDALSVKHAEATKEKKKQAARSVEEAKQYNVHTGLADDEVSHEAETFEHDGHTKPLFDNAALFKSVGRHYVDDADTVLNEENDNHRFFRFSETADTKDLYLMPVTADNDKFGIRREDAYKDDIKLVAVRKTADQYVPIGIDGKELSFPAKNNIIYTSMHGNAVLLGEQKAAAVKYVRDHFVTGKMTDDEIWSRIQEYKTARERIKQHLAKDLPLYLKVTRKSQGTQTTLPKDTVTGLPQELNVEGRLIMQGSTDWKDLRHPNGIPIQLRMSTGKGPLNGILPGRLVMVRDDGATFRVFNRQLNDVEKDNFIQILKEYSRLFGTEGLTKEQNDRLTEIRNYLKNTVFWSLPKNGEDISGDRFWISNGYIHRSKTASSILFNEAEIEHNKEELTKGLYHAINNHTLMEGKAYAELVWGNGSLTKKTWRNYTQYLLAPRQSGMAPVYTNVPTYESPAKSVVPQLKSVYLVFTIPSDESASTVIQPVKEKQPDVAPASTETEEQVYVRRNGDLSKLPKDKSVVYTVRKKSDGKEAFITTKWDGTSKWQVTAITDTDGSDLMTNTKARDFYEKDINETLTELVNVEGRPDGAFDTIANEFRNTYFVIGSKDTIKRSPAAPVATVLASGKPEQAAVIPVAKPDTSVPRGEITAEQNQKRNLLFSKAYQDSMPEVIDTPRYRFPLGHVTEHEDFEKVQQWFRLNLPQFPLNKVSHLINGRAWGQFLNGAVYIYEQAGSGTGLHEAFEAVWHAYLDDKEQEALISEFRRREGSFTNPFSGQAKPYAAANPYDVREMLAEEFIQYAQTAEDNTPISKTIIGKIFDFFKNLWKTIRSYIGLGKEKKEELDGLVNTIFQRINSGYFAHKAPIRDFYSGIGEYRLENLGVSEEVKNYALEGLTATFFSKLFHGRNNIDSLVGDKDNAILTQKLMNDTFADFERDIANHGRFYAREYEKDLGRELSETEQDGFIEDYYNHFPLFRQAHVLLSKRNQLIAGLQAYLGRFGLEFSPVPVDDVIQAQLEKEDITNNPLGIIDAISIDPRKLTSANVNMLIASLPVDEYKNGERVWKRNPINLPQLINFSKVKATLLNELSGCVPVIRDGKRVNNIELMFERLDAKYRNSDGIYKDGFLWIPKLKTRLRLQELNGDTVPVEQLSADDIRMIIGFEKSFTNNRLAPVKLIVGADNYLYDTDPAMDTNSRRIRLEWENAAKARITPNKSEPDKLLFADPATGELMINRDSAEYKDLTERPDNTHTQKGFFNVLKKLGYLGITFSEDPDALFYKKLANGKLFRMIAFDALWGIAGTFKDGKINTYADLYGKRIVNGRINALVGLQAELGADDIVLSHLNAEGKSQYSITIPSNISTILNSLAAVNNQADFIRNNPQLGTVDEHGNVTLNPYQSRSLLLKRDGLLFNQDGSKHSYINYKLISGMALSEDMFGKNTSDLVYPDRVANEINSLLNNVYFTIINSDKGNEFGIEFERPFLYFIDTRSLSGNDAILDVYFDQLADEMDAAYHELANPSAIQYYGDTHTGALRLGHYREILGTTLLAKFVKQVLGTEITNTKEKADFSVVRPARPIRQEAYEQRRDNFLRDEAATIKEKIEQYLQKYTADTVERLVEMDIIQRIPVGNGYRYSTTAISGEVLNKIFDDVIDPQNMSEHDISNLVQFIAINKEIGVTEQHKLVYGHPAMYKDLAKRSNGANSNKEAIVDNTMVLDWMDSNMPRTDGKVRSNDLHQTFRHVTYADVNVSSVYYKQIAEGLYSSMIADKGTTSKKAVEKTIGAEFDEKGELVNLILKNGSPTGLMKPYLKMDEGDGQGNIMPDFYRDLLFLSGKWTKEQEAQWQFEMAYEVIARSQKSKRDIGYKEYSPEVQQQAKEVFLKGNPGAILQPLKPQYFGYVDNSLHHTTFLKHSVQPKFYRYVEGTQFELKYILHQDNQVDVMDYGSGQKVGAVYEKNGKLTPVYGHDGKATQSLPPVQKLFTKFYGIQVEVPNAFKDQVVRGTQVTKLVVSNYIVDGKGINPEAEGMVRNYMGTISKLVALGKKNLVRELGLGIDDEGYYYTDDVTRLVNLLRAEAESRGLPDNMIDAINSIKTPDGNTVLQYKFDSLSNREKIEQILSSIIDSRVISDKVSGMPAVQVASSLYETNPRNFMYLKNGVYEQLTAEAANTLTDEERQSVRMTSNDLKFYRLENGRIAAMEVYLPWHFAGIDPKTLGLKRGKGDVWMADHDKIDKRLLEAIGFRIPTQGMNSIDSIIIKGFIDMTGGNQVVVPSEMVGKSGSDFDIDKLNIYLPNYTVEDDRLVYVDDAGENKAALQNRLIRQMKDLIEHKDNYRQLLMPNSTDTLKSLASEIRELKGLDDEESSLTKLRQFIPMAETRERYLTGKKLVGIAALQITMHTMAQVAWLELTGKFDGKQLSYLYAANYKELLQNFQTGGLSYQDLRDKVRQMDIQIRLDHNVNPEGALYLYAKTDQAGNWISELHSEAISGFVDAAKDPFVFDLNLNLDTAATWFYLQKLGVPVREIAYLHTQPIIEDYFNEMAKNKSIVKQANDKRLSNRDLLFKVASKYYKIPDDNLYDKANRLLKQALEAKEQGRRAVAKALFNERKMLINQFLQDVNSYRRGMASVSATQLKAAIAHKGQLSREQNMFQLANLFDYLEYKQQAAQLSDFIKGVTYDTTATRTIADNRLQEARWNKTVAQNFIKEPERILQSTFLGVMQEQKEDIYSLLGDFFTSLHPKALPAFDRIIDRINNFDLFGNKESQVNLMNRYQNFFLSYLLHTIPANGLQPALNNKYNLLFGDTSLAHQLVRLKESQDPAIRNNPVIKELIALFSNNVRETSNISLFRKNLDSYDINVMAEGIINLWQHAKVNADLSLQKFTEDLSVLSLVQSGLQHSRISIGKILPNELYSRMVGGILDNFTNGESHIDPDLVYKQFHQNNYWNKDIVPVIKSDYIQFKLSEGNVIGLDSTSDAAQNDYIIRYVFKPGISKQQFDRMKKEGRGFEGLDSLLYEKVRIKNGSDSDITYDGDIVYYRRINKLGNRQYFTEVYATDNQKSLVTANQYFNEQSVQDVVGNLVASARAGNNSFDNFDSITTDPVTVALESLDAGCGRK